MSTAPASLASAGIRGGIVVFAALATVLVPHPSGLLLTGAVLGTLLAVAAPSFAGAFVLLAVLIAGWAVAYGRDADPEPGRTIVFAVLLYLAYSATALAASVPLAARVEPDVIIAWARRCAVPLVVTVIAGLLVSLLGRAPGSLVLDVAGLAGACCALAALVWLGRRHG